MTSDRMWKTAKPYPWSSVVGCGVMLLDKSGACIGQLCIRGLDKDDAIKLSEQVAELLNAKRLDRYGVTLMQIAVGIKDPKAAAIKTLQMFDPLIRLP